MAWRVGNIAGQCSHEELLAADGLYARLWARQSGGFLDVGAGAEGRAHLVAAGS